MHHYEYHPKSLKTQESTREKYPWLFDMELSDESIEVRYYLLEYLFQEFGYSGRLEKDQNGKPIPIQIDNKKIYWSVSHSKNYLTWIVSDQSTGIDIAEYEERDISLWDTHIDSEYDILGGKNWYNFYILWTAKESIIKQIGGRLDDMRYIVLREMLSGDIALFAFHQEIYRIQTLLMDPVIISHSI